jgi:Ulp1 family protease
LIVFLCKSSIALNEDELRLVQTIIHGDENESFGSIGDQPITRKDIRTLRGLTWLNDEVRQWIFNITKANFYWNRL